MKLFFDSRLRLRQILTPFLAGLVVLLVVAAPFGGALLAQAAPAVQPTARDQAPLDQARFDQARSDPETADSEGGLLDNIREKLNLDEPLPESTKLFFKQVQGEDVEVEEPRPSGKDNQPLQ